MPSAREGCASPIWSASLPRVCSGGLSFSSRLYSMGRGGCVSSALRTFSPRRLGQSSRIKSRLPFMAQRTHRPELQPRCPLPPQYTACPMPLCRFSCGGLLRERQTHKQLTRRFKTGVLRCLEAQRKGPKPNVGVQRSLPGQMTSASPY